MRTLATAALVLSIACKPPTASDVAPDLADAAQTADALSIYDELEQLIATGKDTEDDRQYALDRVRAASDDGTAAYAFARAAIIGRVAELRGIKAGKLVTEAEHWAKTSVDRDPEWRDKAATRMLGSLWVMAPSRYVEHGDSEEGLALLETLAQERPDDPQNRLRAAEAYVFLGDTDPATSHLCGIRDKRAQLRPDEQALYDRLVEEATDGQPLACED